MHGRTHLNSLFSGEKVTVLVFLTPLRLKVVDNAFSVQNHRMLSEKVTFLCSWTGDAAFWPRVTQTGSSFTQSPAATLRLLLPLVSFVPPRPV